MYKLNQEENKILKKIQDAYYMPPLIEALEVRLKTKEPTYAMDDISDLIQSQKDSVDEILEKRKRDGHISNIQQARKSIVGNIFSNCLIYLFLASKKQGLIDENIFITDTPKSNAGLKSIITIHVGDEIQQPDMDLAIYSHKSHSTEMNKIMILSLKTSLRERAGQTYRWKLLMEIASEKTSKIKDKYNITYNPNVLPLVCFATVNFYDEINNPQHRGMFKFFDQAFIGKQVDSEFIARLSTLADYVNKSLL